MVRERIVVCISNNSGDIYAVYTRLSPTHVYGRRERVRQGAREKRISFSSFHSDETRDFLLKFLKARHDAGGAPHNDD